MAVSYAWSGGLGPTSATVAAKVGAGISTRLVVSLFPDLSSPSYFGPVIADAQGYVKISATSLASRTSYYYGLELSSALDAFRGQFATLPPQGSPASFSFAHASCQLPSLFPSHPVHAAIKNRKPTVFLHLGDFGYPDIATNDQSLYRANFDQQLTDPTSGPCFANVPIDLIWDDHDFGPNDSDRTAAGAPAAAAVYRQVVPSYSLPAADSQGIYHSFWIGRVFFIVTDLRSYRDPDANTDDASKTMLGTAQKAWFKQALLDAQTAGAGLIVWASSSDMAHGNPPPYDGWTSFTYERQELFDFFKAHSLTNLAILTGDVHAISYDLAQSFASTSWAGVPIFLAAALSAGPTGTAGHSPVEAGDGHYASVDVTDDGTTITVDWQARHVNYATGVEDVRMRVVGTLTASSVSWVTAALPSPPVTLNQQRVVKAWDGSAWQPRGIKVWDGSVWRPEPVKTA